MIGGVEYVCALTGFYKSLGLIAIGRLVEPYKPRPGPDLPILVTLGYLKRLTHFCYIGLSEKETL